MLQSRRRICVASATYVHICRKASATISQTRRRHDCVICEPSLSLTSSLSLPINACIPVGEYGPLFYFSLYPGLWLSNSCFAPGFESQQTQHPHILSVGLPPCFLWLSHAPSPSWHLYEHALTFRCLRWLFASIPRTQSSSYLFANLFCLYLLSDLLVCRHSHRPMYFLIFIHGTCTEIYLISNFLSSVFIILHLSQPHSPRVRELH